MHMDAMAEARTEFTLALQRLADDFGSRVEALTNRVLESNNRVERIVADALREKGHP
jgi:lambda repressor-like predicted transcriptional regulator